MERDLDEVDARKSRDVEAGPVEREGAPESIG